MLFGGFFLIRSLSANESANLKFLQERFPETSTLILTATGFDKSIMDATIPLRVNLKLLKIHNYESQQRGSDNKVLLEGFLWTGQDFQENKISLYRPETKDGDPRIWVYGLKQFSSPDTAIAISPYLGRLYVFNLTKLSIVSLKSHELFISVEEQERSVAEELLVKLRFLSRSWIPSLRNADCGVGDTLEHALGIKQNSSKNPDFKGIEIKSKRSASNTRSSLFAQVPDWEISNFKSSKEILDYYGYLDKNSGLKKLYVTVSALRPNPQGLKLIVNYKNECVEEVFCKDGKQFPIVRWRFETLINRLTFKHKETFWIKAESHKINNEEFLLYTEVEHTKKPVIEKFFELLESGAVTLDHLIKEKGRSAIEKGPLFKLNPNAFDELFLGSQQHMLVEKEILKNRILELKKLMSV